MANIKTIELAADIENPKPDRRSKDWFAASILHKGRRFTVHSYPQRPGRYPEPASIRSSEHEYGTDYVTSDLGKLIVANSIEVEPTSVRELKRVHDCDYPGDYVLSYLLKMGRITAADFAAVGETINNEENENE